MLTGGCACGALRYRAEGQAMLQGFCHCRSCQRTSGGGHVGWLCFADRDVTVEGATTVYTRTGGSGRQASRFACPVCLSVVYGTAAPAAAFADWQKSRPAAKVSQAKKATALFTMRRPET